MKMNLPNSITIARLILIPFFMIFMIIPIFPETTTRFLTAGIFAITAFTDFLDGYLARKLNLVTDFGKFLDPVVDKLMIFGAFFGILVMYRGDNMFMMVFAWAAFIVVFRETAVTSLRMIASNTTDVVIAANFLGKIKTVSQIVCVLVILLEPVVIIDATGWLSYALIIIMTIMTLVSGVSYFKAYLPLLDTNK
jgi:CDP-diacylglycerol--glycerol-3-phosphate 3-phosphatidyltransferase